MLMSRSFCPAESFALPGRSSRYDPCNHSELQPFKTCPVFCSSYTQRYKRDNVSTGCSSTNFFHLNRQMLVQTWVNVISSKRSNVSPRTPCMASTTASRSPHVWVTLAEVIAVTLLGFQKAIATQHCKRLRALMYIPFNLHSTCAVRGVRSIVSGKFHNRVVQRKLL